MKVAMDKPLDDKLTQRIGERNTPPIPFTKVLSTKFCALTFFCLFSPVFRPFRLLFC